MVHQIDSEGTRKEIPLPLCTEDQSSTFDHQSLRGRTVRGKELDGELQRLLALSGDPHLVLDQWLIMITKYGR